uniref:Candidate secreted effector n=1 Tax=Meloidogyne incognita TaxID=6306 RepID=A0A914M1C6_MELIC
MNNIHHHYSFSTPSLSSTLISSSHIPPSEFLAVSFPSPPHTIATSSVHHMRLALTVTHLLLVSLGSVN